MRESFSTLGLWQALIVDLQRALQPVDPLPLTWEPELDDLGSIWQALRSLAMHWGKGPEGERLLFQLQQRLAAIASQSLSEEPVPVVSLLSDATGAWQRLDWPWLQEILEMAGGTPGGDWVAQPATRVLCFGASERFPEGTEVYQIQSESLLIPGTALPVLLETLAEILQPALFHFDRQDLYQHRLSLAG